MTEKLVEVRCWRCKQLLFKVSAGATGKLEELCKRCKARNGVDLGLVR